MLIEFIKFLIYSGIIVIISKYVLVNTLRKLAETLNLKPKTVGDIAGYATSMPEYVSSIFLNKNQKVLKNRAIKIDLILVAITIIIPIILFAFNIEINIGVVPIFIGLCVLFVYLNSNVHKLYLKNEDEKLEKEIEKEEKWQKNNKIYILFIVLRCVAFCCGGIAWKYS